MPPKSLILSILEARRSQLIQAISSEERLGKSSKIEEIKIHEDTKGEALRRLKTYTDKLIELDSSIQWLKGL